MRSVKPGTRILTENELSTPAGQLSLAMAPCHVRSQYAKTSRMGYINIACAALSANVAVAKLAENPFIHNEKWFYYAPQLQDFFKTSVNALKNGQISQQDKWALCADTMQVHKV